MACYLVYDAHGMEGIALFYGLVEVAKAALYLVAFRRVSGSLLLALVGFAIMQAERWASFRLFVFRPQTIGEVFWAALLAACAWSYSSEQPRSNGFSKTSPLPTPHSLLPTPHSPLPTPHSWPALFVVPLLVCLWANVHGAFLLAFVFLGTLLASRYWERLRKEGQGLATGSMTDLLERGLQDSEVRRLALVLVLSLAAACVNPYGPRLLIEMFRFSKLPVLQYVTEWQPLLPLYAYESKVFAHIGYHGPGHGTLESTAISPARNDFARRLRSGGMVHGTHVAMVVDDCAFYPPATLAQSSKKVGSGEWGVGR